MKLIANYYLALFVCFFNLIAFSNNSSNGTFNANMTMQRVRINFESPNGFVRPLLLGFTTDNSATDGVDYGYDGANFDQFPDDMFWLIENDNYVIQGVGAFDNTKQYPLGLFLENSGTINISLNSLENFDSEIDVFVYDNLLDTYTAINDADFSMDIADGNYLHRFYITFTNLNNSDDQDSANSILNVETFEETNMDIIRYLSNTKELLVKTDSRITQIEIYALTGQKLNSIKNLNSKEVRIPLQVREKGYTIVNVHYENSQNRKMILIN